MELKKVLNNIQNIRIVYR